MKKTLLASLCVLSLPVSASLPGMDNSMSVQERKEAFFEAVYQEALGASKRVVDDKNYLNQDRNLNSLCIKYKVKCNSETTGLELAKKVDLIKPSQILAQAAIESGWGTSRFALEGNNIFGVWCWTEGCGLKPSGAPEESKYWVKRYSSIKESINDYILNLNTHDAYQKFRDIRFKSDDVIEQLNGLEKYSQEEGEYIAKLQAIIKYNNLKQYDERFEIDINN
ncbi:glucosaminidase domain-containing protein [Pseudoalteromonas sp. OFAV1]|uniref:glucosaminidase domain-containing protein n=1 Tax=Pseudoalteromonas sp. OFAV1 TaxID=2908892 RepID=UPI001F436B53|nr:glucosaminidase domain-containing protein [Pseudoalteromonas sp. OFAV1]MCF2902743.1 glucosaminidase domain-containing protein [Pseudoalteromonas sp. OFAV1]